VLDKAPKCSWHVDAHGLWPESYETPSQTSQATGHDQDGVNAWVALSDMPLEHEGSMALSRASHRVPWRYDAYESIARGNGRDNGGETWDETVRRMALGKSMVHDAQKGTRIRLCSMDVTAPDLNQQLEDEIVILDLKAGDVVFCTRNLFHRTLDVLEAGRQHVLQGGGPPALNRYTIRYTPGTAILPTGYCYLEWSLVMHPEMAGWTLDEAVEGIDKNQQQQRPYWFPQVWPASPSRQRLQDLLPHVQQAKMKSEEVQKKLFAEVAERKRKSKE